MERLASHSIKTFERRFIELNVVKTLHIILKAYGDLFIIAYIHTSTVSVIFLFIDSHVVLFKYRMKLNILTKSTATKYLQKELSFETRI